MEDGGASGIAEGAETTLVPVLVALRERPFGGFSTLSLGAFTTRVRLRVRRDFLLSSAWAREEDGVLSSEEGEDMSG